MGLEAHEKISKVISNKMLLADMENMTEKISTKLLLKLFHAKNISTSKKYIRCNGKNDCWNTDRTFGSQ